MPVANFQAPKKQKIAYNRPDNDFIAEISKQTENRLIFFAIYCIIIALFNSTPLRGYNTALLMFPLSFMDITARTLRVVAGSREALCAATLPKASVYGKRQIPAGAGIINFKTKHASVVKWI